MPTLPTVKPRPTPTLTRDQVDDMITHAMDLLRDEFRDIVDNRVVTATDEIREDVKAALECALDTFISS